MCLLLTKMLHSRWALMPHFVKSRRGELRCDASLASFGFRRTRSRGGASPLRRVYYRIHLIIYALVTVTNNYTTKKPGSARGRSPPKRVAKQRAGVPGGATPYPQLLHDPCLTPNMAETENKDGAERGAVLLGTGGNTGAGVGAGSVTMTLISRRC